MRRFLLVSLILLVLVVVTGAAVGWYLLHDEDFLKARLGAYVTKHTGRDLNVEGPLTVTLGRRTRVDAHDISFRNAAWAAPADMLSLGRLSITVDVLSLFGDTPVIHSLALEDCDLRLQENEAGQANWDVLPESGEPSAEVAEPHAALPVLLMDTQIRQCQVSHDSPQRDRPLVIAVDDLSLQLLDGIRWSGRGSGRLDDESFSLSGNMEPAGAFLAAKPLSYEVDLAVGRVALRSSGSIEDPQTGRGANLDFRFSGPEMSEVLEHFNLPILSAGAFDFRLHLDSEDRLTRLEVDGDLGSLMLEASGQFDRLLWPQSGALQTTLSGPDLRALGETLGLNDLVPEAYTAQADLSFDSGATRADILVVETRHDRLELSGVLGRAPQFANSDLTVRLTSGDISRWGARTALPVTVDGPASLHGSIRSDANGHHTIQADLEYAAGSARVAGDLGTWPGKIEPDFEFVVESPDIAALLARFGVDGAPAKPALAKGRARITPSSVELSGAEISLGAHRAAVDGVFNPNKPYSGTAITLSLESPDLADLGGVFGRDNLPAAPLSARGRVSVPDHRLRFEDLSLDLAGHRTRVNGYLNPERGFADSNLQVDLDSPDIGALAALFGAEGIPREAMKLGLSLAQEGRGLRFQTRDGSVGEVKLQIDGRIADLDQPLGLDANFDIRLPTLTFLGFLAPEQRLPDLPLTARGRLNNEQDHTRLQDLELTLGSAVASVAGNLFPDRRFALSLDVHGPDASLLDPWVGQALQPQPFSLRAGLEGDPTEFAVSDLDARLGRSDARGALHVTLAERKTITGRLESDYLDLGQFRGEEEDEKEVDEGPQPRYVFKETPIVSAEDPGVDLDLDLAIAVVDLGNTDFQDLELRIGLKDRQLDVSPFSVSGSGGGTLSGRAALDARGAAAGLRVEFTAQRLRLGLAAAEDQPIETFPTTDLDVLLSGEGATWRELASSLDGKIRVFSGEGKIAASGVQLLMGDFLTELFTTLNPFATERKYTTLECSVMAATILDGKVSVYPVVYQTKELTILSKGAVDLHTEDIDLSFNTKPRQGIGLSAGVLINPLIKVGGRLVEPAIELDPKGAAVSGGLAVATAGISLLAKSAYDRFLSSKDPCGDARAEIEKFDRGETP